MTMARITKHTIFLLSPQYLRWAGMTRSNFSIALPLMPGLAVAGCDLPWWRAVVFHSGILCSFTKSGSFWLCIIVESQVNYDPIAGAMAE